MNQPFTVTGMTCGHCEMAVKRALRQIDPEADVAIDRAAERTGRTLDRRIARRPQFATRRNAALGEFSAEQGV